MADYALRRYSNLAPETNLDGAVSSSATTISVVSAAGYPSAPFTLSLDGVEIVLVTAVSSNTLTVTRGFDGSIAAAHADNVPVKHVLTADDFDHRWQDVIVSPDFHDSDDEFDDGSKDSDWIETAASGTATWTESNGVLSVLFSGQSANDLATITKPVGTLAIGSGIEVAMRVHSYNDAAYVGPVFSSGYTTTDNVVWQAFALRGDQSAFLVHRFRSGTMTAASTEHYQLAGRGLIGGWIHMRLVWVTVNTYRAWWSIDGVSWTDYGQGSFTITAVSPPARMGVAVSAWGGSGDKLATVEHFRIWEP